MDFLRTTECIALAELHEFAPSPLLAGLNDTRLITDHPDYDEAVRAKKEEIRLRYEDDHIKKVMAGRNPSFAIQNEYALQSLLHSNDAALEGSLQSVLQSIVIETWSAFEILVYSLWEGVAQLKNGFGVGIQMNRHRKDPLTGFQRKTGFRTLDGMRFTYQLGFFPAPKLLSIIDDMRLFALASVRNVLVHRNGIADAEFVSRQPSLANTPCFAPFVSLTEGQPLKLTGISVRDLKAPAIDLAFDLVSEVDLWVTANP